MPAKKWFLANKIKSVTGMIVGLAAVIVLPVQLAAWAEDLSAQQVRDAAIAQQAKEEVIHGAMRAKHDLDFAKAELEDTEEDLIELEEEVEAGVTLTPTQQRKYERSRKRLDDYEQKIEQAEKRLAIPEKNDESNSD